MDSGHNKTQNIRDALGHLIKNFTSLGRVIDASQEITNRGGYSENSVCKRPHAASHRHNGIDHGHNRLTAQIQNGEEAFEGSLQLIRRFI